MKKNLVADFSIVLFFIFLPILYTYPLIFRMHSSFFGDPQWTFDSRASIYSIWLTRYQWLNKIPFSFNPLINFPFGVDLTSYPSQWGLRIPLLALSIWKNDIFSFNFFILTSFILSAIIVYYLVLYVTGSRISGFISGFIYSFSPYHTLKAFSHLGLAAIQWIPLYILFLILLEQKRSYKMAWLCGVSLAVVVLSSYYYGYIAAVATVVFLLTKFLYKRIWGVRFYIAAFGIAVVLILPFMFNEIFTKSTGIDYVRPYYDLFRYSARVSDYLRPSEYHPIFGKIDFWFIKPYTSASRHWAERTLYIGILPLVLAICGVFQWKRSDRNHRFIISYFLLSGFTAFLFSVVPEIKIGRIPIYLPNYFAYKIFPMFRCPARFGLIVILCIAVLAGIGMRELLSRILSKTIKGTVITSFTCIILFEFTVIPPFRNVDLTNIPEVYRWLSNLEEDKVIAEYPFFSSIETTHNDKYLFYQRIHQKKLVNGAPGGSLGDAFRKECIDLSKVKTLRLLRYLGADYVIVHKDGYDKDDLERIRTTHGLKLIEDLTDAVIYELIARPARLPVIFWQNFANWEKWDDGKYWRWMGNNATIWIGNRSAKIQDADIKFKILTFARERRLEIYVNKSLIETADIVIQPSPRFVRKVILKNIQLQPGENIIRFYTSQGEDRIGDVMHNDDNRRVSFATSDFILKPK